MELSKTIEITLLALLRDESNAARLASPLWSIFRELESFYASATGDGWLSIPLPGSTSAPDVFSASVAASGSQAYPDRPTARVQTRFHRRLMSTTPLGLESAADEYLTLPADFTQRLEGPLRAPSPSSSIRTPSSWDEYQSRIPLSPSPSIQQFDARAIGATVQGIAKLASWILIVTDLELTPPATWRYIIWDIIPSGAVVSTAPVDPVYWGEPVKDDTRRTQVIKTRTRAACLSVIGSLLGLERCQNQDCYLYANVDSVVRLDEMTRIGPEHGVAELTDRGFGSTGDPNAVETAAVIDPASPSSSASA